MQSQAEQEYPQGLHKALIVITIMLVAILEVLDMTIVNVALAPMMGALGANSEQITWVLTSYIVSAAIFMLLTGFLTEYLGRKKLLLINIVGFTLSSVLCGLANSLTTIVLMRTLQGIFGACLIPLAQVILRSIYPKEEHGKAQAIWGIGLMVAPVMGPTLGGYITEWLNWRWLFFVNLPVGIIGFFLALKFISESVASKPKFDFKGMLYLMLAVGSLQLFLDRGNSEGWLDSHFIVMCLWLTSLCFGLLIYHTLTTPQAIINLRLYQNRNFAVGSFLLLSFVLGMMSILSLEPLLLEHYLNYPTNTAGLVMAPQGLASAVGMIICSRLVNQVNPRWLMLAGLVLAIHACWQLSSYNLSTSEFYWIKANLFLGLGMGLYFVPVTTLAFKQLTAEQNPMAAGLFSFARNIGVSVGISIMSTLITRESQINWHQLSKGLTVHNSNFMHWLAQQHWTLHNPIALQQLAQDLMNQSGMIAFIDAFYAVGWFFVLLIPALWLFRNE